MRRQLPILLLLLPLLAYGQVVVTPSGWATSAGPAVPVAPVSPPQVVPGNVALPGSGTPTGAPPDLSVNNAATGGYVTVYQPGVMVNGVPVTMGAAQQQNAQTGAAAQQQSAFNSGMGAFVGSNQPSTGAPKAESVAEIAARSGNRPQLQDRKLTNEDLASLDSQNQNGKRVITNADLRSLSGNNPASQENLPAAQQNPAVASERPLDRGDLNQVENALANSQSGATAEGAEVAQNNSQEYQRVVQEAESGSRNSGAQSQQARPTEPATPPANSENASEQTNEQANGNKEQLPASGSPLPMLALVGLIAIGTGMVYRWKTR